MAIYKGSRYQTVTAYGYYNGSGFTPMFNRRALPTSLINSILNKNHTEYQWKSTDRIDMIAYNRYGDSSLWWAIMDANPQYMTPYDIQPGDNLILPTYEAIREALGNG